MSRYSQGSSGSLLTQYPTPGNTQPQTNSSQSQSRTPSTHQNSQSNTTQIVDSFLSDVPQGIYSECSTLDNSSTIPTILQDSSDLTPHTPESLLYSPAPDAPLGDDLNSRKQLRRSPRNLNNQTPQTFEKQSDSTSSRSQESSNNRELINKNPAALALKVLNESTDFNLIQQIIEEKNALSSRNLDNHRMEIDTENRDINELRDLITTSNMILDTVHHNSASHNQMRDIEYTREQRQRSTRSNNSFTPPHEISQSELQREHEHENEYPESVELVISNEISNALLRQSEHYNNMASKFSNLKFIKVKPESDEEIEQFNTSTPGLRRSSRKKTTTNYSYPRYSYGGGSNKRSRTRKRSRSFRKGSLPTAGIYSGVVNKKRNNEPVHELSPIQSDEDQEANEDAYDFQYADDGGDVESNLYLKHDLRSRKIMLELPDHGESEEESGGEPVEEPVEEPVAEPVIAKKMVNSKRPAKKSTLKEKPVKAIKRRSTSRKKTKDPEWNPNEEIDSESGNDSEAIVSSTTSTPRGRRTTLKPRSASKSPTASKKAVVKETTPETSTTKRSSGRKATPKTPKTPKTPRITRMVRKSTRGRGRGRGRGGSRLKNSDTEYKYSGEEESESEVEIEPVLDDIVNDNSENQFAQESFDIEMDSIQEENVEDPVSTPTRPKRTRKSTKSPINKSVISTPKHTRSTRSRDSSKRSDRKKVDAQFNNEINYGTIHEPSDEEEEEVNTPEVQEADLMPKKPTRGTKGSARGGKVGGQSGHIGVDAATNQPSVPTSDPDVVEVSAGNPMALANAVRVLAGQNYDIVHTPEDIENIVDIASIEEARAPVFVKPHNPATNSASLSNTPPPESYTSDWSQDHWQRLKVCYEETKDEYISSGKVVGGNEDVYKEVTKRFFEADINNRTFGEEHLRMRIIALESANAEKSGDSLNDLQRRSSIESNSSRGSVSHYNKAYSNLRDNVAGTKRKRSESNATSVPENKKDNKNEEDDETKDKVSKRPRVEENTPSGSISIPAAPSPREDGMLSKLFGGWFRGGRSQSNPALFDEETPGESDENENTMEGDEPSDTSPTRSRSWLW